MKFINYINEKYERQFEMDLKQYHKKVRTILPTLPKTIDIYFKSDGIAHGMNTGGYAYSPDIISIAIGPNNADIDAVRKDLKATFFHEAYHIVHNYTGSTGPFSLLECAIQEGAATIFEQKYTDSKSKDLYGNYGQHPISLLNEWLEQIKKVKNANQMSVKERNSIAFYDETDNIRWKLYKTGTWLVSQYISKKKIDIKDFTIKDVKLLIKSLT
jgi:uncharacterized protein YjaZ